MKNIILESLLEYVFAIVIVIATLIVANLINMFLKRWVKNSAFHLNSDPTNYLLFRKFVVAFVYVLGFGFAIFTIPELKLMANSLLAGAGILSVAIGFASQQALSNVVSGIFIVVFKPFKINDRIHVHNHSGIVEDITLRHTVIRDFENKRIVIPNAVISNDLIINSNYTDNKICKLIDIDIDYDSDIVKAKGIIRDEILKHPLHIDGRSEEGIKNNQEKVTVRVTNLGDSSVSLRGWAWSSTPSNGFVMSCDLKESIKLRFDAEGIVIPYPHRTIVHKSKS